MNTEDPTFGDLAKGEKFLASARTFLVTALADPKPRIPTIQGLLILGGRQCAVGQSSEGWVYTGMAIRMMTDLGLHLDLHRLAELESFAPADLELRKRLYCSAYVWDKTLSLSLGRPPSLTRLSPTAVDLFDHRDNQELWQPAEFVDYPVTKCWNTMCFAAFCRLGQIVEMILMNNPGGLDSGSTSRRVEMLEQRLQQWWEKLPEALHMSSYNEVCPPPHIFSLNLLYYTLQVILWRPYRNLRQDSLFAQRARTTCVETANTIHGMFLLYSKTFNLSKMTYLISYCVYSAATVDVEEMRSPIQLNREAAAARLGVSLRILENEARQTPGVGRSIDIIRRQLRTWTPRLGMHASTILRGQSLAYKMTSAYKTQIHQAPSHRKVFPPPTRIIMGVKRQSMRLWRHLISRIQQCQALEWTATA